MELIDGQEYFISAKDVVLRKTPSHSADPINHLLFGDYLRYDGEQTTDWAKIFSRRTFGWIPKSAITDKRMLEINFIDIGQGDGCHIVTPDDEVILIDSGIGDNMHRFLSWRYNLRDRKVIGVDGVLDGEDGAVGPFEFDHVVITHPDKDHYYGFKEIFENPKVKVKQLYHNGIVERPIEEADKEADLRYYSKDDLGGYIEDEETGDYYIWDVVNTTTQMHSLVRRNPTTQKNYLSTLRAARQNNPDIRFTAISIDDRYLSAYNSQHELTFKVLGPVSKRVKRGNTSRKCLLRLGGEGVTKNGHSITLQLQIGQLKVLLGGDLNTEAEDHLFRHYTDSTEKVSSLENSVKDLNERLSQLTEDEQTELNVKEAQLNAIVAQARRYFRSDIAKACHHGSHHFSDTFLRAIDSIVTVISSGDNENYSHPRPEALGAFGKYGRGSRPLIFSTELARSTTEFTNVFKYFEELTEFQERIAAAPNQQERNRIRKEMEERRDRNVVVYGMISIRTDGQRVVISQKLERPKSYAQKWDIHELLYDDDAGEFRYVRH